MGYGVLRQVGSICKGLGFKTSVAVLAGSHIVNTLTEDVIGPLEQDGFRVSVDIVKESNISSVEKVAKDIEKLKPSVVLGIGGGKVIDVAKLAAFKRNVSFISIPTALSHDGISSSRASIKGITGSTSIEVDTPTAIIGDLQIILKSPHRLTASGCGDIVAKYTAVNDWKLSHRVKGEYYGNYAANLALMSAKLVMGNAEIIKEGKEEGLRIVLEALISCGVAMCIAGSSRPCSGSEHLFSHALDIVSSKPALHGEQCGIGSIMMAYLWRGNWKALKEKLEIIGAPTTAKELGVDTKCIVEALTSAHKVRSDRYTIL
ncbi:MAG: NAD(P)-dependent glycerol-1-phosphate dehydrogenase, partial [Candidatus Bathyarchaeota archaeon]